MPSETAPTLTVPKNEVTHSAESGARIATQSPIRIKGESDATRRGLQPLDIALHGHHPLLDQREPLFQLGAADASVLTVDVNRDRLKVLDEQRFKARERLKFELRGEAYNLLNAFTGADPDVSVTSATFGKITAERSGIFGRQIQFSGRLIW